MKPENKRRYSVCVFPALHGLPWMRDSRFWAFACSWWRSLFNAESRIIDNETGDQWVHKARIWPGWWSYRAASCGNVPEEFYLVEGTKEIRLTVSSRIGRKTHFVRLSGD